ncbi:hypothetical protein [Cronobacter sakazakii]|uniref:hypothetical protein n=1 Tax=Cronobacter sakazakii TaxID=28141 RepID=UPI0004A94E88|nr:hypothetical protein [Cronobacter sakazakii]ELY2562279.1 hypothetical protein [Cronobacter sakazakii]ELY2721442.1 hypothetical protein [Cronobacter sakazakii]ELY2773332.1 hypothetical protein [Cronobacter sakazakii]ELY4727796.1 hypothetical protein [Cronobacter sakazakii]ELY4744404.1 hypothetical protein [Cronobacter sakazakii]
MSALKSFVYKTGAAVLIAFIGSKFLYNLDHNAVISAAGALSTISGVLFGFVLASVTILSSFDNSKGLIGALQANGVLKGIIESLFATGMTLIAACISAMVSMFAPVVYGLALDYYTLLLAVSYLVISMITFCMNWKELSAVIGHA